MDDKLVTFVTSGISLFIKSGRCGVAYWCLGIELTLHWEKGRK
jgi:hypothetical protein